MKELKLTSPLWAKLKRLPKPPNSLFFIGEDPSTLTGKPVVAIVGTRKVSAYGKQVTEKIASELARAGVVVVSGNALGVDVTAQKAAIEQGGSVIAVVASGLDNVYPATNRAVANLIVSSGGSILSEYEDAHNPRPEEFLERNRIIAAISDVVIVTEAAERSGSLNTAAHAAEMGIPVFAVPGPITSPLSAGTNKLIKDGAKIFTETQDILDFLGLTSESSQVSLIGGNEVETKLLVAISDGVHDSSLLQQTLLLETSELQTALTMLEIKGRIRQNAIGNWHLS